MFKFKAITKLQPTEDSRKVSIALKTILEGNVEEEKVGIETYLYIESTEYSSMDKFYNLVRKKRILDVARKTLRSGLVDESTIFFVNKQVACIGRINFCTEEGESPLGPIRVEIEHDDINKLIDWLTPYTKNGSEVRLVKKFP